MKTDIEIMLQTLITAGWANETDGSVTEDLLHVALIDLTTERDMMQDIVGDDYDLTDLTPAWYVVTEDGHGFVGYAHYPSERAARQSYGWQVARLGD